MSSVSSPLLTLVPFYLIISSPLLTLVPFEVSSTMTLLEEATGQREINTFPNNRFKLQSLPRSGREWSELV